jgi:hypothetical protein
VTGVLFAIAAVAVSTQLTIAPWSGKDLATVTPSAAKYKLTVKGAPGTDVHLVATRVAGGWLAAFCTPSVCSPDRVNVAIPDSGETALSFELIREDPGASHASGAVISAGTASVTVPAATR